jgi:amino acid transporter
MALAVTAADSGRAIAAPFAQVVKRTFLGKPLVTAKLKSEKLSNAVALGTVAPDPISSSCYGTEQILLELVPAAGMAAFVLLLPVTGVILLVLALVAASYRQVVMAYTQAGGSYVVARENFGPRVAQVAAAALLIDYVVTVAVQTAAGTVAVVSAIPVLGPLSLEITVGVVMLICFINLRGVREAGRPFAVATYSFVAMTTLTIVTGVARRLFFGGLPIYDPRHIAGAIPVHHGSGLVMGATVLVVLRAFANGGSSLTGVEAISNSVNVFGEPQGVNARRVITAMACILGFLLAGVGYLAYATHATPYRDGYPSVLSQEARAVFGHGLIGNGMFIAVQASSAAILYTGANGSFNGFPALASFVAEDQFLPRQLMKRGHRLVFSNGIVVLTALSMALLVFTGGSVNALVPLYAIGVFIGFSMAGYGMSRHHLQEREPGWRHKLVINLSAGIMSTIVVGIFLVAKFTEGAWLIAVVFPLLVLVLMRLNNEYREEAAVLKSFRTDRPELVNFDQHHVFACVNTVDIAVFEALRYGKSLRPDQLTAVHFKIDEEQAQRLQKLWDRFDLDTPLRVIDCPDRQLSRAAQELVAAERNQHPDFNVTVLLPRRAYGPLGRLLHDRTADKIAKAVSRTPGAAATIVPYDVQQRISEAFPNRLEQRISRGLADVEARIQQSETRMVAAHEHPRRSPAVVAMDKLTPGRSATIEGRVSEVEDATTRGRTIHSVIVGDDSGQIRITFGPEHGGAEIVPGQLLRVTGQAHRDDHNEATSMSDPAYQVVG